MTIKELQTKVDNWIKDYGVRYFDEKTNTLILVEEVGEFARLISRKYGEQSFKKTTDEKEVRAKLKDELSDVIFVCTCLANQMNIDITEIMQANILKKTDRDAERHLKNDKLKP